MIIGPTRGSNRWPILITGGPTAVVIAPARGSNRCSPQSSSQSTERRHRPCEGSADRVITAVSPGADVGGQADHRRGEQAPDRRRPAGLLHLTRPRPARGVRRHPVPRHTPKALGPRGQAAVPARGGGMARRPESRHRAIALLPLYAGTASRRSPPGRHRCPSVRPQGRAAPRRQGREDPDHPSEGPSC